MAETKLQSKLFSSRCARYDSHEGGKTHAKPTCMFFDEKASTWSTDGCAFEEIEDGHSVFLKCKCNHMTTFMGAIEFIPNEIAAVVDGIQNVDFDEVLEKSSLVFYLQGSLIVLYFIFLVVFSRKDAHDSRRLVNLQEKYQDPACIAEPTLILGPAKEVH